MSHQLPLFKLDQPTASGVNHSVPPFRTQLLKWVGNKQRFAHEIVSYFPKTYNKYYEPFLGSGAVLGTIAPEKAIGSDIFKPLIEIWQTLQANPKQLKEWYTERWNQYMASDKVEVYEEIKAAYNFYPNAADLLFLSRSCYGGVIRFRTDGYMSTPCGVHQPITPTSFGQRVDIWHTRTKGACFLHCDFEEVMNQAEPHDVIYCDPPYTYTQSILYGAQSFSLERLFNAILRCKERGVYVILSIDGTKKTDEQKRFIPLPKELFEHEVMVNCGRSMLRRFQMAGETLEKEFVSDRLLLTY